MRKIPLLIVLIAAVIVASCSKSSSELANSIPDDAFLVASFHPKQIYDKGQISSMESFTKNIDNDFLKGIIQDPMKSGVALDEYAFVFVYFNGEDPIIGTTTVIKDEGKFTSMIEELIKKEDLKITESEGYKLLIPENDEAGIAWNEKQAIFMTSPDNDLSAEEWKAQLLPLFDLPKEEAVTSIVDFNDFSGKMKDMNLWFTGDKLMQILEKTGAMNNMKIQLPMDLYNNYGQFFAEFVNGAMYMHAETHLSDDVSKAAASFVVAKDELNAKLLELAPGNDLLYGMAASIDLKKLRELMKNMTPPEMDGVSDKIKEQTGVSGEEILNSLSGDIVIAVNGAAEGANIPVEVMIGIGLDDESLQDKMMGTVGNMAQVEKEGDFFMINANGIEIYSGIVDGIWVITNTPGYKDAVSGKGLKTTLKDSKFGEFAGGSSALYMNLDITTYPPALQGMMTKGNGSEMLELLTESLSYIGMEASNFENDITLKTAKENENSLYTLLKILEKTAK